MSSEIIVALIGLVGVILTAAAGVYARHSQNKQRLLAEQELRLQRSSLDFSKFVQQWDSFIQELEDLMRDTNIDRFLLLRAWNGKLEPKWTTAVFQLRKGRQKPIQYVHFELDEDYVNKLRSTVRKGDIIFNIDEIPESIIKGVYEVEGVTSSLWMHVETQKINKHSSAITYCSFSTHDEARIDNHTRTRCLVISGRLKQVASQFVGTQNSKND